jgi:hypothetical protein
MGGLFNSIVLDVAIGLAFVYLLLSLLCTTVNEWIAGILNTRSKTLQEGIRRLLDDQPFAGTHFLDAFYQHPVITGMMRTGGHPSYLAGRTFATAVVDLVTPAVQGPITLPNLVDGVNALPDGDVKKALVALVGNVGGDLGKAQQNIERWFDDAMDRVSGWYKRTMQKWTVVVAVVITVLANADTLNIARQLWVDPTLRSTIVEQAKQRAQMPRPTGAVEDVNKNDPLKPTVTPGNQLTDEESAMLGRMIGWTRASLQTDWVGWLQRVLGWIFTAIAVSLGAPFWFDTLNRIINLRNTGKAPAKEGAQAT